MGCYIIVVQILLDIEDPWVTSWHDFCGRGIFANKVGTSLMEGL